MKRLFLSLLIFYPTYAILHYGYVLLKEATGSTSMMGLAAVFFLSTVAAVYFKIKKDGRVFTITEKLVFVSCTWGIWAASVGYLALKEIEKNNTDPTSAGLFIVGLSFLVNFAGVWLVISTYTNKIFAQLLNSTQ